MDQKSVSLPTADPLEIPYKLASGVQDFLPQALDSTSVRFTWTAAEGGGQIDLRRVPGEVPPADAASGTAVATGNGAATDTGLNPGTVYTYGLFEGGQPRFHWTLRTADLDADAVASNAYVLDSAAVLFHSVPAYQVVDDSTVGLT